MHESSLYPDIIKNAKHEGIYLLRLMDGSGVQPFDLVGFRGPRVMGVEVKVDRRPGEMRWNDPLPRANWFSGRSHQLVWLSKMAEEGGLPLVVFRHLDTGTDWLIEWQTDNSWMVEAPLKRLVMGRFGPKFTGWNTILNGVEWASLPIDRRMGVGGELTDLGNYGGVR